MSEFLDTYKERNRIQQLMKAGKFKLGFEDYQKLKDKKEELTKKLKSMCNET